MHFYIYIQLYFIHVKIWAVTFWHNRQSGQSQPGLKNWSSKEKKAVAKTSTDQLSDHLTLKNDELKSKK